MRPEFLGLSLALLLCGCGKNIPASGPKLQVTTAQKNGILEQYQAIPVINQDQMWVRGHGEQTQDCRLCHDGRPSVITRNDGKQSHWDVNLHHSETMKCSTCHDENHPEQLVLGDQRVGFDQAYELCGSCHFQQKQDFLIGAHGKRLTGWAFPRIVKNCTECHKPHQPKFIDAPTVAHPTIIPPRLQHANPHE
jgi:hypothetical protein